MPTEPTYPEHEKMKKIPEEVRDHIGRLFDYGGYHLAIYMCQHCGGRANDPDRPDRRCPESPWVHGRHDDHLFPAEQSPSRIVGLLLDIDEQALAREKDQMLAQIRKQSERAKALDQQGSEQEKDRMLAQRGDTT